ncbi:MAG: extracellular solute-binding protein [Ruminococcaceae bacterium]|nr:extracellular solute-binding protein [Oscillospiraceae bacterium]
MKKTIKFIALFACFAMCLTCLIGCTGNQDKGEDGSLDEEGNYRPSSDVAQVEFWINGDKYELDVFSSLADQFNEKYKGQIKVNLKQKPSDGYETAVETALTGNKLDLFYVGDAGYKAYAEQGLLYDITDFVENSKIYDLSKMWPNVITRYKYDVNTKLSGTESGRYYGVPKDIGPTVIYYNETEFEKAGIKIISVGVEQLEAYNGGAKDDRGNTKADVGLADVTVKEYGYFVANGQKYFNNQIPMSWDETVEIANILQNSMSNPNAYGYFTEWWFNYGWSVGGDCIEFVPSTDSSYNGGWYDFTLNDDTPNFIVADDVSGTITVNGNSYKAGEIITYQDKLGLNSTSAAGEKYSKEITAEVTALLNEGKLNKLPSQREAFTEFVRLAAKPSTVVDTVNGVELKGYGITPTPSSIGSDAGKTQAFAQGEIAMLVDGRWDVSYFRDADSGIDFTWDVCPLPMYREYDVEGFGAERETTVHGIEAGHSGSVGICINKNSELKAASWKFIEFVASAEGQTAQAKKGFAIPLQKELANTEVFLQTDLMPRNSKVFINAAEIQGAGDWWYLTDNAWIDDWAGVLNGDVRNGKKSMTEFFESQQFADTYGKLLKYTEKR